MNITVLNYLDHTLAEQITAEAAERAAAEQAAREAALAAGSDFSTVLDEASQAYSQNSTSSVTVTSCPEDLASIFEEASVSYGVSKELLMSIARAESGFSSTAVSSAGAVGIMQLMPATAASLGVSNSYDPRENIMGGAKLISQLLTKYNGDTSLALAAYNSGSANVDKYGGIPPFAETQNYVQKVLNYLNGSFTTVSQSSSDDSTQLRDEVAQLMDAFLSSGKANSETLKLLDQLSQIGS